MIEILRNGLVVKDASVEDSLMELAEIEGFNYEEVDSYEVDNCDTSSAFVIKTILSSYHIKEQYFGIFIDYDYFTVKEMFPHTETVYKTKGGWTLKYLEQDENKLGDNG